MRKGTGKTGARRGSALLIVLGMLSFMVVSAVGLSMRMRASRLPSSYLRRNVAARSLVKAALARAVDELEGVYYSSSDNLGRTGFVGVYDNPYPGCNTDATEASNPRRNGDFWLNRVFMPLGPVDDEADTVPTMTFEALAYLPPAIMDDVRALARRTRTAMWHSLPYDSGRYAYCAVNVSDLFDINRLRANKARNSSANGRVTLASLCCDSYDDPMSVNSAAAADLDRILDEAKTRGKINGNAVPFTSLADFNLVAGQGCEWAPFFDYVGKGAGANLLMGGSVKSANALFITDTWFPTTNDVAGTTFDLEAVQPFKNMESANCFLDVGTSKALDPGVVGNVFAANLGIGLVCLYDYLDRDNVPLSLALPTTEAVPMVVGISSPGGLAPQLGEISGPQEVLVRNLAGTAHDADGNPQDVNKIVVKRTYSLFGITSFGNRAMAQVVAVCPFKRLATTGRAKSYSVRGLLRVWMAPEGMGCRPDDPDDILFPDKNAWAGSSSVKNGVATFVSDTKTLSDFQGRDVKTASDALAEVSLMFSNLGGVQMPLYYKVSETVDASETQNALGSAMKPPFSAKENENTKTDYVSLGDLKDNVKALRPLALNGSVAAAWKNIADSSKIEKERAYPDGFTELDRNSLPGPYRLYAALWVQVMDGNDVVDMVPATFKDDVEWYDAPGAFRNNGQVANKCGPGTPVMNFMGSEPIAYADIEDKLKLPVSFAPWKSLYAVDPRFNFAPEDWFMSASATATKGEWITLLGLDGNTSDVFGKSKRDHDMFMFVSDQEYLQSIGELQFLPWLEDMDGTASANMLSSEYTPNFHGKAFSDRPTLNGVQYANGERFWKTYTAYSMGDGYDPLYSLPYQGKNYVFESGSGGYKLNPYSDDDRVVFAGLIGTPFDYYMASTNTAVNTKVSGLKLDDMMDKYSFGEGVACAKITDDEMSNIADRMSSSFRSSARSGSSDWLSGWNGLGWQKADATCINDENKWFFGQELSEPLHGVDRKFLYSFWRECFANRQQLFLVFVRAEPSVASVGGANDRSSSQMGGRAVALVWRDPTVPEYNRASRRARGTLGSASAVLDARDECPPHRTRVLFYHQFE